jgi:hypothetical protein
MLQKATRAFYAQSQRMFSVKRYFLVEYEYIEDAYYKKSTIENYLTPSIVPHREQHLKTID